MTEQIFRQQQMREFGRKGMGWVLIVAILVSAMALPGRWYEAQAAAIAGVGAAPNAASAIAYVAGGALWLINADGTNPRQIWQLPDPANQAITDVDWSPDGTRLAFASDHESLCSFYRSDIYSINIDGTDLRRLTNSPACAGLAGFAKGSVQVTIKNELTESLFLLYVQGAAKAVELTILPGLQRTVTVDNVADFGDGILQQVVIFQTDEKNWIVPSVTVDVRAGETTAAADHFVINNNTAARSFGAYSPSWRRDGQAVAFALSTIGGFQIGANPTVAEPVTPLFPDASLFGTQLVMSPVDERVLLYNYPLIGVGTVGDQASMAAILELSGTLNSMDWLADGSGLVASEVLGLGNTHANIWRYTIDSAELTYLTHYNDENPAYAFDIGVAPDGTELVFAYAPTGDAVAELQIMDMDGGNVRSLGVSGLHPDWGIPGQVSQPTPTPAPTQTPSQTPGPTATSVAQPTPSPSPTATNGPQPTPVPTLDPAKVTDEIYLPVVKR